MRRVLHMSADVEAIVATIRAGIHAGQLDTNSSGYVYAYAKQEAGRLALDALLGELAAAREQVELTDKAWSESDALTEEHVIKPMRERERRVRALVQEWRGGRRPSLSDIAGNACWHHADQLEAALAHDSTQEDVCPTCGYGQHLVIKSDCFDPFHTDPLTVEEDV